MNKKAKQQEVDLLFVQGATLARSGNLKAAKVALQDLLKLAPDHVEAASLLGSILDRTGHRRQAVKLLLSVAKTRPENALLHFLLGNFSMQDGQIRDAISHYRAAVRLKSSYAEALNNLGLALSRIGDKVEAKSCFSAAIACGRQGYADPHHNLGIEFKTEGRFKEAVDSIQASLRLNPKDADAWCNLGSAYLQSQKPTMALNAFEHAAQLQPHEARWKTNLGSALIKLGRQREALERFQDALKLNPADASTHSNLVLTTSYVEDDPGALHQVATAWGERHAPATIRHQAAIHDSAPDRRLRIGYISGDFRQHAAAYWIEPLLEGLNHDDFEVLCYSNSPVEDEVTERIKDHADVWVPCASLSDDQLFARIRTDHIDILVDLSSHTEGNRLKVFARQPAPIQVSWFGFPITTGIPAMQYRLTDSCIDPPSVGDRHYSETLLRIDRFYAAYKPDARAPEVGLLPCTQGRPVTFGSLNTLAKVSRSMLMIWADILASVPHSRILLQSAGLEDLNLQDDIRSVFSEHGIKGERVEFRGWTPIERFLHIGQEIDIALDPFPFNGGVTSCHALWMGLPVVTLRGRSAQSRVGASLLHQIECDGWIADNADHYRQIAIAMAGDIVQLANLRSSLRGRMERHGVLDGRELARQVESRYRDIWRLTCSVTHVAQAAQPG